MTAIAKVAGATNKTQHNMHGVADVEIKPTSFLARLGQIIYVQHDGKIIGEISQVARRRHMWKLYKTPVPISTTRKKEPPVTVRKTTGSISNAIWALKMAAKGSNA